MYYVSDLESGSSVKSNYSHEAVMAVQKPDVICWTPTHLDFSQVLQEISSVPWPGSLKS